MRATAAAILLFVVNIVGLGIGPPLCGWLIDLFLIPSMDRQADLRFQTGRLNHTVAWILLTFLALFGIHRFYMGKWLSGIIYLLTGGLFYFRRMEKTFADIIYN